MERKNTLKASLVFRAQDYYLNNSVFNTYEMAGRKSDLIKYALLRDRLLKMGIDLSTPDLNNPIESKIIINIDHVLFNNYLKKDVNQIEYLILTEIPSANVDSWMINNHGRFNKIFTYNLDIVDDKKYIYLPYTVDITIKKEADVDAMNMFNSRDFLVMVANPANHVGRNLLYHKREDVLNWYNKNHDSMLSVYGTRWHSFYKNALSKKIGFIKHILPNFFQNHLLSFYLSNFKKVFKGVIPNDQKKKILEQYKFNVCFENEEGPTGNISEKIFDSFEALTIPIYLGANNVADFIPKDTYIDFRQFCSIEEMHHYLVNMDKNTYTNYIISIIKFLNSESFEKFKHGNFLNIIENHLKQDLQTK